MHTRCSQGERLLGCAREEFAALPPPPARDDGSNASRDFISAVIPLWGEVCVRTQRRSDGPGSAAAPC